MWIDFLEKLANLRAIRKSNYALFMNPGLENLPLPITRIDDPFFPYGKEIIRLSQNYVVAYVFDLASYLSLGAAGAVALERTIRFASRDNICILHAPFASEGYSAMADVTGFGLDALTLTSHSLLRTYLDKPPFAAFVIDKDRKNIPDMGGIFLEAEKEFLYKNELGTIETLHLTDENFLFQSKRDDYLEVLRENLEALR